MSCMLILPAGHGVPPLHCCLEGIGAFCFQNLWVPRVCRSIGRSTWRLFPSLPHPILPSKTSPLLLSRRNWRSHIARVFPSSCFHRDQMPITSPLEGDSCIVTYPLPGAEPSFRCICSLCPWEWIKKCVQESVNLSLRHICYWFGGCTPGLWCPQVDKPCIALCTWHKEKFWRRLKHTLFFTESARGSLISIKRRQNFSLKGLVQKICTQ